MTDEINTNSKKLGFLACMVKETQNVYSESIKVAAYILLFLIGISVFWIIYSYIGTTIIYLLSPLFAAVPWWIYLIIGIIILPLFVAWGKCIERHTITTEETFYPLSFIISFLIATLSLLLPYLINTNIYNSLQSSGIATGQMFLLIMIGAGVPAFYSAGIILGIYSLLYEQKTKEITSTS